MTRNIGRWVLLVCAVLLPASVRAQVIDLAVGGADQIWVGTAPQSAAGLSLDQGAVSASDSRRDLIIGAPGAPGVLGHVYVIFGGPIHSGTLSLADAQAVIAGASPGDEFGFSTASGNIWNADGSIPRSLLVGAPNAGAGGTGTVYLFRGGFGTDVQLTTADALLEVRGQAGDRLGTSLATADINGDGYRDMVLGAAGNDRVYVVYGGPSFDHPGPTVVRDLAATPADLTITGAGIGDVLVANDITGDNLHDVVIGAPTVNTVHIIEGRSGSTFAAVWDLATTPADITLIGTAGEAAGIVVRLANVAWDTSNTDKRDLLIGAPGADAPSGRTDAGAVYMVLGGTLETLAAASPTTLNLASADVRFYGRQDFDRLGAALTVGDINRDAPNDVVAYAPGAAAAGQWFVYYGRSVGSIGTPDESGIRIVDLGAGAADRSIIGDPARGPLAAAQVFEVTGEGARDIIVAAPASDSGAGAVFFTISPKLRLSSPGLMVNLNVTAGQGGSAEVLVKNSSTVSINWAASANRNWITANPGVGTAVNTQDGSFQIRLSAAGLPPGSYSGTVTVRSTSPDLEMALPIAVTMTVEAVEDPDDFSGDGTTFDLVWQHRTQGWLSLWRMSGTKMISGDPFSPGQVADTNWHVVGTGDFNGDGRPDLLWQHQVQGWVSVWLMNGTQLMAGVSLSPDKVADTNWKIRATGDFNGDGQTDILWQHLTERWLSVWLMAGTTMAEGRMLTPSRVADANWHIVGTGDFNSDTSTDIVWQNQVNGSLSVWYMNGTQLIDGVLMNPGQVPDTDWKIVGVGDVNADGKPDLVWHHMTNGSIAAWIMNGITMTSGGLLSPGSVPDTAWKIVGPR